MAYTQRLLTSDCYTMLPAATGRLVGFWSLSTQSGQWQHLRNAVANYPAEEMPGISHDRGQYLGGNHSPWPWPEHTSRGNWKAQAPMQNWAVEFLGVAAKKSILINKNGSNGPPRCMFASLLMTERNPFLMCMRKLWFHQHYSWIQTGLLLTFFQPQAIA